ncbi:hypothetical protein SAMN05444678_101250 [Sphingomonas sp. YR710]|jgi:hypothetical protein|nr:hypothetical protein SAMN05444678_101250 [Sphingomonas sp. YR710]
MFDSRVDAVLAKRMERLALAAIAAKRDPQRWIMTAATLTALQTSLERAEFDLDAPRLITLEGPMFMNIPIDIGVPMNDDPPVDLVTR